LTERRRVYWAPSALGDFEEILEYVRLRDSAAAAKSLGAKMLTQIESLAVHPMRCRLVPELLAVEISTYRELILKPYRVFFRVDAGAVQIVGVLDGRRDLETALLRRVLYDKK
jgi:toxin ParE1/3/4